MRSYDYKTNLIQLLPQLYHTWDRKDGSLKKFIQALGETLDDMEKNISELYTDSFIESCHEWIIPYIGELIGARLVGEDGIQQRREVMNTISWRKRKGTLKGLEDMAREITGWGVWAVEFFEQLGWSQNLNHIKPDHLQSPDLRDEKGLFYLGGPKNRILHTMDIREPGACGGWFQIKNIGFFLSAVMPAHYRKIPMQDVSGRPNHFALDFNRFPVDIFDGDSRFPMAKTLMKQERFDRFGTGRTIDVFDRGVLTATPEMPVWKGSPKVAPPHADLLNLKDNDGIMPMDWRVDQGEALKYTITAMVLHEQGGSAKLDSLGVLDLSGSPLVFNRILDGSAHTGGRLVLKISPHPGYNRAFPDMILKIVSHNQNREIFSGTGDRQSGVYQDRQYCCLPELQTGSETLLVVDRYGGTYLYDHDPASPQPPDETLFDFTRLKRAGQGVVYPSRKLTASARPHSPIYSLAKNHSIAVVDRGQFTSARVPAPGWTIKAWNRDNQPGGGVLRLLTSATLTSQLEKPKVTVLDIETCEKPGHLVISLHGATTPSIPEMEVIVTDERGDAVLVYLPQVDHMESEGAFFFVASDGATYRVNAKNLPDGLVVKRAPKSGPGGALNPELLGKRSAGQVLGIEALSPIQHRIPVRCDLSEHTHPHAGVMAIDPNLGRIAFAQNQRAQTPLHAGYYHGLSAYVGAGAYFHNWDVTDETRVIHVCKRSAPNGYRHLRAPADGVISKVKIHHNIQDAVNEVLTQTDTCSDQPNPWVIQIEDSEVYAETISINQAIPCGLIIRSAEFKRPVLDGIFTWNAPPDPVTPMVEFQGLMLAHTIRFQTGRFIRIQFNDCTLLQERIELNNLQSELDRYPNLSIERCIIQGEISVDSYCRINITDTAIDAGGAAALTAMKGGTEIERCTIMGSLNIKTLTASETIFIDPVTAINTQKGCVRYSRISKTGNTLPRLYKCTTSYVTFCSDLPWHSAYLKLKRRCGEDVVHWAENGGEIGVFHQAEYTRKEMNLNIKFDEYLPVGLKPVLIDMGCDPGTGLPESG